MIIVASAIISFVILVFILTWSVKYFDKYDKKQRKNILQRQEGIAYHFLMFLGITLYLLLSVLWSDINELLSILVLLILISLTNKIALMLVNDEVINLSERKFAIVIALVINIFWMMIAGVVTLNNTYWTFVAVAFAVLVGFYVPLDLVLDENTIIDVIEKILRGFETDKIDKKRSDIAIKSMCIIISLAYFIPLYVSKKIADDVSIGILIGIVTFIVILYGYIKIYKRINGMKEMREKINQGCGAEEKANVKKEKWIKNYIPELIIGIVVSVTLPLFSLVVDTIKADIELYKNIENISFGTGEEYMTKCFGIPKLQNLSEDKEILENVYYTDNEIIRAYFVNGKLEGYFITVTRNDGWHKVRLPPTYRNIVNNVSLGAFTYYDISGKPMDITAYATQGYSHYLYCEEYYFGSSGRYNQFYFGYFDYGYDAGTEYERDYVDVEIGEKYFEAQNMYGVNRKRSYPNTYGICSTSYYKEIYELVVDYYEFDWDLVY